MAAVSWNGMALDYERYLSHIGLARPQAATIRELEQLQAAHLRAFSFENIDSLLRRPANLDLQVLQHRMLATSRGNSCAGQTTLFAAALERAGYFFTVLSASVIDGGATEPGPATHALLYVGIAEERWICDVGFGRGPLWPIRLVDGEISQQPTGTYRISHQTTHIGANEWLLSFQDGEQWKPMYTFAPVSRNIADLCVTNYYVTTHPDSPFRDKLLLTQTTESERRVLAGRHFTVQHFSGEVRRHDIEISELPDVVKEEFGITLAKDDMTQLQHVLSSR